jgi:AhpD family alkylhydroperoxidase
MTQALRQQEQVERVKLYQVSPELYEAMQMLSRAAAKDIEPDLAELIKIRASQMNRCVFCLDMHSNGARKPWGQHAETRTRCRVGRGGRGVRRT